MLHARTALLVTGLLVACQSTVQPPTAPTTPPVSTSAAATTTPPSASATATTTAPPPAASTAPNSQDQQPSVLHTSGAFSEATDAAAAPIDVAAPPVDAPRSATGLAWRILRPGSGNRHPSEQDRVVVHYSGWTTDGHLFDSSRTRGEPARFAVNGVIRGWTETLQFMVEGEQRRVWIPAELAYGDHPTRQGAPAGMLVFDIELLEIAESPAVPPVPVDVSAPPANAERTTSGLRHRLLQPGTGKTHPERNDRVRVQYTGWTTDGRCFDSSVTRQEPSTFPVKGVIAGFAEGIVLMTVGEKRRLWIPAELAYGVHPDRPGAPAGMLVFDVELLEILTGR